MTAVISPPMFLQFFNPLGLGFLAGGKLFTYLSGTSTKTNTWTDSTQSVLNSNPIILDSQGACYVWLDPTITYKFVLAPSSDTDPPVSAYRTVDNIAAGLTSAVLTQAFLGSILYPRTAAEIAAGVTPTAYSYFPRPWLWVPREGVTEDGVTDDYAALNNCILVAGSNQMTLIVDGPVVIGTNITIPTNVEVLFIGTGAFNPKVGINVTFNGFVNAGPRKIFGGAGNVNFTTSGKQREFRPEWWGAVSDGATNSYTALQACNVQASAADGKVLLQAGGYLFTSNLDVQPGVVWQGVGKWFGTTLIPSGAVSLRLVGASVTGGYAYSNTFRDVMIDGRLCTATQVVQIDTAYNLRFENVFLYNFATLGGNTLGINAVTVNDLTLDQVTVYAASSAAGNYGIKLGNGVRAHLIAPDVEVCNRNIYITGTAQVDIFSPYLERHSAYGIYFDRAGAGFCNVFGGDYENSNAGCDGIGIANGTENVAIHGGNFALAGGKGIETLGATPLVNVNVYDVVAANISDTNKVLSIYGTYKRYGSATYDPPSLADGAGTTTTVTVAGAALGDYARASFSLDLQGITLTAWVSAAGTVSVRFQNESGGVLDLGSGTLRAEANGPN